ncbi:MAG: CBASS oligonucleotide cyclase [Truepera sp.]|nr:CBASS oligonucleotide cyclase [Truepera sp.]
MGLTNKQLRYFDVNVLRLEKEKRTQYHGQVDRLIKTLNAGLKENDGIIVKRAVKAGSFAKHTILRKAVDRNIDVDVVFYISGRSVDDASLKSLSDEIFDILSGMYPNKSIEDFELGRKTATVTFVGSGISVDVVPVIEDEGKPGYGWQFDPDDDSVTETCAPCQIQFVRDRKAVDADFRTLVRLAKLWRTFNEVDALKSFMIELIMAHVLDVEGVDGSIQYRFLRFLLYIAQSQLLKIISFPENTPPLPDFADPVVIVDPVCSANNVAARMSESERAGVVDAAHTSWEAATFASTQSDHSIWKEEIFGPRFRVEDD